MTPLFRLARVEGIEPPIAVLETAVMPLNYTRNLVCVKTLQIICIILFLLCKQKNCKNSK